MKKKSFIPCLYLKNEKAVKGFKDKSIVSEDFVTYASSYAGADGLLIFDLSSSDAEHEAHILLIRKIIEMIDIPVYAAGNIKRLEDVKKLLYAGCKAVALNMAKQSNIALIEEAGLRFGKAKMMACVDAEEQILDHIDCLKKHVSGFVLLNHEIRCDYADFFMIPVINDADDETALRLLTQECVCGLSGEWVNRQNKTLGECKAMLAQKGIDVNLPTCSLSFSDLKLNSDGHVPVVVQDYRTDEVLMVAYMDQEAFESTVRTGRMTYYSRSRKEQWVKGATSGHYQYVRALYADCDHDTILAKVHQIGAACHTGNRSCFFEQILSGETNSTNPMKVFDDVFAVILDRKQNPREGSYTNYLFDKGLDKILKKVGEEATEIVIAAKNPEHEEVRYEIADFLYHMMVLMAECGLTWEDITTELANR